MKLISLMTLLMSAVTAVQVPKLLKEVRGLQPVRNVAACSAHGICE